MLIEAFDYRINILIIVGAVLFLVCGLLLVIDLFRKKKEVEHDPEIPSQEEIKAVRKERRSRNKQIETVEEPIEMKEEPIVGIEWKVTDWQADILARGLETERSYLVAEGEEVNDFKIQTIDELLDVLNHQKVWSLKDYFDVISNGPLMVSYYVLQNTLDPDSLYFVDPDNQEDVYDFEDMDWAAVVATLDGLNAQYEQFNGSYFGGFTEYWNPLNKFDETFARKVGELKKAVELLAVKNEEFNSGEDDDTFVGFTQDMADLEMRDIQHALDAVQDGRKFEEYDAETRRIVVLSILFYLNSSTYISLTTNSQSLLNDKQVSLLRLLAEISEAKPYDQVLEDFELEKA